MSAPLSVETLESLVTLYDHPNQHRPSVDVSREIVQTALYYARRCEILEGQLTKTRADLREIVSDATTSRAQAALAEDPYPQDPNEV